MSVLYNIFIYLYNLFVETLSFLCNSKDVCFELIPYSEKQYLNIKFHDGIWLRVDSADGFVEDKYYKVQAYFMEGDFIKDADVYTNHLTALIEHVVKTLDVSEHDIAWWFGDLNQGSFFRRFTS